LVFADDSAAKDLPPQVSPVSRSATRDSQEQPPVAESPQEEETRLTKNWGGARTRLSDLGIDVAFIYKGEFNSVLSGGLQQRSTYLGNLDLRVSIDGEKLMGWKGGSAFFYVLSDHGGHPTQNVGDSQATSNIETSAASTKLYEAWVQQVFYDERLSLLAGLHDLNSEFYVTDSSSLFFNSTFGIGRELSQTGTNGPSIFPVTSPAFRIRTEPSKEFYFQAAIFNGQAGDPSDPRGTHISFDAQDGFLFITEAAYTLNRGKSSGLAGKYGMGFWTYTRTYDHLTQTIPTSSGDAIPVQTTSRGIYFLTEQNVSQSTAVFLRYGIASTEANRFSSSLGTGIVFTGLIPHRPKDRFGLGFARAANGEEYQQLQASQGTPVTTAESTIEANYRIELLRGIAVQPDFQYVLNPNTSPDIPNAAVGAVRLELNF
jgi:porin